MKFMAHAGGRPTDYSPKMIEKARKYIESCVDKHVPVLESVNTKTGRERFIDKIEVKLPTIEGLCLFLKIARKTAYNWANEHDEFLHILEELNQRQAERLINKSINGEYNSLIAKLLLTKHGYKDQVGVGGEGEGEGIKVEFNILEGIKKAYGNQNNINGTGPSVTG